MISTIDGQLLKKCIINGAYNLENNKKSVDDLNVFPVPDGDTGTNMSMTINAAAQDLLSKDDSSVSKVADYVSGASLRGARGNSGVILSQLFRGFYRGLKGADKADTTQLAEAVKQAKDTAYKAVMKPTEGTILTVARETADYAVSIAAETPDILEFTEKLIEKAKESLNRTPDLLPVLKQAGVVDAGGMGLVVVLEGVLAALKGEEITLQEPASAAQTSTVNRQDIDTANIKFMYCTEFIINKRSLNYSVLSFRESIAPKGDSMLVIEDDDIVKVHIHTNNPGFVLEQAVKIGDLSNLKIDNMKLQHTEILFNEQQAPSEPEKEYGIVAVSAGDGLEQILKDIGVDVVVKGGQSMNPSTDDILQAVNQVNAKTVYVLPNNKNIILAAQQVDELTEKTVIVIPSKTIPQGISAVLSFDPSASEEDNTSNMTQPLSTVKTGSVTFAARDSEFDGMEIKKDDIMGMEEGKITVLGTNPDDVALQIIDKLMFDDAAVISIFYGEDVTDQQAAELEKKIDETYSGYDVMVHKGGQPLYYYIISVE